MTLSAATVVWDRHQGDVDDTIVFRLDGIDVLPGGTAIIGWVARGLAAPEQLTAAITNLALREVTVSLGADAGWLSDAAIGTWRFVATCDFQDGRGPITWPEKGHAEIRVHGPV